ncbi:restriction system protein [Ruminococcaceae bacterium P7]|nr:restriction system protein [Ruminococcaceae bacterium P7]
MSKSMTIVEAIKEVLMNSCNGLTSKEIYKIIMQKGLYEFKAQDPVNIVNVTIRKHCFGLDFPSSSKNKFFEIVKEVRGNSKYINYLPQENEENTDDVSSKGNKDLLPEEQLQNYYADHIKSISSQLMEKILNSSPKLFEDIVVDLLMKMGYGYDDKEAGSVTNYTHDGGVDGIIKEDKLGLDTIYIQAKRYSPNNKVSRNEVDQFATAMGKKGVKKGVFITTSSFAKSAISDYSKSFDNKTIILIDGEKLMKYMVKYEVGIENVKTYKTYQIKDSYFY